MQGRKNFSIVMKKHFVHERDKINLKIVGRILYSIYRARCCGFNTPSNLMCMTNSIVYSEIN